MFRLRLLGGASIARDDGTLVAGRAAQRHRLALLALLACSPGAGLSRDKLIGLLWPESDAERARNLLNVSVYVLRKALGEDALLSGGDDLRLNPAVVCADVVEFDVAIERGDHDGAVALYRGPLLDGFFVNDAPEFEHWADRERERLAGAYARSLEALAEGAERRRDFQGAAGWWRRRAAHDPYDSRVAECLMRALDAGGNRAGALQLASVHERLLEQEFGMPAASAVRALAARMRAEPPAGASPAAAFEATEPAGPAAPPPDARPEPVRGPPPASVPRLPESSGGARHRVRAAALALLGIAAVVGLAWALRPAAPVRERSVAVLPFVNMSPDAGNEYFSDGVTEEIITRLSAVPTLKVISRTSAMRYKGSPKSLREIARELDVAHVLEGSVRRERGTVRIAAQLIDAAADHHLWAETYDRDLVDVFAVQEEIARAVGRALEVELGEGSGVLAKRGTRDPEAYELYLRGRFLWHKRTKEGHVQAVEYFRRAIELDSTYADAHSGLSDAYFTAYQRNHFGFTEPESETYSRIKWAAERAVALDDESAAAHTSLAIVRWWQRDWPAAERELRRAIALNPGYALARSWYSVLLSGLGRMEEGVQESRHASELDPFAIVVSMNHGARLFLARRYDRAIEEYRKTLEIDETWSAAHRGIGLASAQKGMHAEAVRALRQAVETKPDIPEYRADLAYTMALAGGVKEAREILRELKAQPRPPHDIGVAFAVGRAHIALGEPDSAFAWFDQSEWRWPHLANVHDPTLDPLRADPRFARLSARVAREMRIR